MGVDRWADVAGVRQLRELGTRAHLPIHDSAVVSGTNDAPAAPARKSIDIYVSLYAGDNEETRRQNARRRERLTI